MGANFGSVRKSMLSLFLIMNGDTSPIENIVEVKLIRILFIMFMMVSNWAALAILTSVMSDHMIAASERCKDEDEKAERDAIYAKKVRSLRFLFQEIDQRE